MAPGDRGTSCAPRPAGRGGQIRRLQGFKEGGWGAGWAPASAAKPGWVRAGSWLGQASAHQSGLAAAGHQNVHSAALDRRRRCAPAEVRLGFKRSPRGSRLHRVSPLDPTLRLRRSCALAPILRLSLLVEVGAQRAPWRRRARGRRRWRSFRLGHLRRHRGRPGHLRRRQEWPIGSESESRPSARHLRLTGPDGRRRRRPLRPWRDDVGLHGSLADGSEVSARGRPTWGHR